MGLLDIRSRHASAMLRKIALKRFARLCLHGWCLLHGGGNGLTGQIVLGWPQTTGGQNKISPLEGAAKPFRQPGQAVTEEGYTLQLNAQCW
jgi:hypothetical protein